MCEGAAHPYQGAGNAQHCQWNEVGFYLSGRAGQRVSGRNYPLVAHAFSLRAFVAHAFSLRGRPNKPEAYFTSAAD